MNAMIFAAGLGSRLKPYTNNCPKALIKVAGCHLLEIALNKVKRLNVNRVVVNVHHHAQQIIDFIGSYDHGNLEIVISDESDELLDTGGGLIKAMPHFDENSQIIVLNADVVTNANIHELINYHSVNKCLATLLVANRNASRYLLFDDNMLLQGWENPKSGEFKWVNTNLKASRFGFNGVQIIDYNFLKSISNTGAFPIIPEYLNQARNNKILGFEDPGSIWFDVGDSLKLESINNFFENKDNSYSITDFF